MKRVGFTQTGRRTIAGTVAAFTFVATGITIGGLVPAETAEALDGLELVSINAYWDMSTFEARSAPNGGGTLASVPCLEDGISDPPGGARTDHPGGADQIAGTEQSSEPLIENQWRWLGSDDCSDGDVDNGSGLGFTGVEALAGTVLGDAPFAVGQITHFNIPVSGFNDFDDGTFITVDLVAQYEFVDLTGSTATSHILPVVYELQFHETPNNASPCAYPDGPNGNGCADRMVIVPPATAPTADIGGTTVTIDINQFFPTDADGDCLLDQPSSEFLTGENSTTTACAYGVATPGDVTVTKQAIGGSGDFEVTISELSQVRVNSDNTPNDIRGTVVGSPTVTTITDGGPAVEEIIAGIVRVEETSIPAGWEFESVSCTDPDEDFGVVDLSRFSAGATGALLDVDSNEELSCQFVNRKLPTITIEKVGVPTSATPFTFTTSQTFDGELTTGDPDTTGTTSDDGLPASFDLAANGASQTFTVDPGTFSFTEAAETGWQLTDLECTVDDSDDASTATTDVDDATATVTVGWGDEVTCTYTNTQDGRVIVEKVGAPAGGSYDFQHDIPGPASPFSLTIPATDGSGAFDSGLVTPGSYTITELLAAANAGPGPDVTGSAVCTGETPVTPTTGDVVANVTVSPGETVTCTFTNNQLGRIVVEKSTTDGDGTFTFDLPGTAGDGSITTSGGDGTSTLSVDVVPGTYSVTETIPAGWDLTGATCALVTGAPTGSLTNGETSGTVSGIVVGPGDVVTCSFTNARESATLELRKEYVGGVADDETTISIDAENDDSKVAIANGGDGAADEVASITVYADEQVTLSEAFDPNGTNAAAYRVTDFECTGTTEGTDNGGGLSYTTTVTAAEIDAANAGSGVISCAFTNTSLRGDITIIKNVQGDDASFDFEQSWDGETADPADFSLTTAAGTAQKDFDDVLVPKDGQPYTISEIDPGAGYGTTVTCTGDSVVNGLVSGPASATAGLVGTIGLDDGEDITCTFNNTENGTVIIEKVIENAIGVAAERDFSFSATGLTPTSFTLDDDPGSTSPTDTRTFNNVVPGGSYTVSETVPAGWELTSLVCDDGSSATPSTENLSLATATINVDPAEVVTCTFTNTALDSDVQVTKTVTGVTDAIDWSFGFTLTPNDTVTAPSPVSGAASPATGSGATTDTVAWTGLVPGAGYTISEDSPTPGYEPGALTCNVADTDGDATDASVTFVAPLGDDNDPDQTFEVLCDITNDAIDPTLQVDKTTVGGFGEFTFDVTPTDPAGAVGPVSATTTAIANPASTTAVDLQAGVGYTVSEQDPGSGWSPGDLTCEVTHAGETTAVTYTADATTEPGDVIVCEITNTKRGEVTVDKTDPAEVTRVGTTYSATYQITVANESYVTETYTLVDTPDMAANVNLQTVVVNGPGVTDHDIVADGSTVISDASIAARAGQGGVGDPPAHVFTVVATFTLDPVTSPLLDISQECLSIEANYVAAKGAYNHVSVSFTEVGGVSTNTDDACTDLPEAELDVTKTGSVGPAVLVDASTNRYQATYTVEVENTGAGPGSYSLSDLPDLAAGATNVVATIVAEPTWPVTIDGGSAADPTVHTYTVEVAFDVAGSMTTDERTCATVDTPDRGAYNQVTMTIGDGSTDNDTGCVDIPTPGIDEGKSVESVVRNADGTWTVSYLLDVHNLGAGPAEYDLSDEFKFGTGVTVVPGSVSATIVTSSAASTNGGFDGDTDQVIVDDVLIGAGDSHQYRVTADVSIAVGPDTDGDCVYEPGENSGLLNTMTVSVFGQAREPAEACAGFAQLTLAKNLTNDDGGPATLADFPLTAAGDPVTLTGVSGTDAVMSAVPAGAYDLSEEVLVQGYESGQFTCEGGSLAGQTVTLVDGDHAVCTVSNDDEPVDLELTKDDGGFAAVAGGDPVPYTITVQNIGDRDADTGEPVTVVDTLPTGMSWNDYPADCSPAGQVLTCDLDPALLGVGDPAVVIDTLVDVAPDAPSGEYENHAYVTTEDDPVCEGDECVPPPCEDAAGNNNVDCDTTPVERFASVFITKTDDVADGDFVRPGETYSYELVVGNLGPSTVLADLVIDDDLPGELEFVSTSGDARWDCNDADPLLCTWTGGVIDVGETLPPLTVTVSVVPTAVADEIVNTAITTALVDALPPLPDGLLDDHFGGVGEIVTAQDTERTPLQSDADLAVVKTASVAQVGAGNSFTFELDVTNNGPATAINVAVDDLVPSKVRVTKVASTFFDCSRNGNDVSCTRASMAVGQSGTVLITVRVPQNAQADTVINIGTVESDTPDPNLDNNSDDAEVIIVAQLAPTTAPPPTVTLPPTGSSSTSPMLQLGVVFLLLGVVGVAITRRRHTTEPAA